MPDILTSGEEDKAAGFSAWAGRRYSGPRIPPLMALRKFNFTSQVNKRAYAYATLMEWTQCYGRFVDFYQSEVRPNLSGTLLLAEDERVEKAGVNWRAIGIGRLLFASEFRSESEDQALDLRPIMVQRARRYLEALSALSDEDLLQRRYNSKIKINKGKGAPFWQGGTNRLAGLALAALSRKGLSLTDLRSELSDAAGGAPMIMTMYSRIQGNRKPVSRRRWVGNSIVTSGSMIACKVRTVKAPPFVENNVSAWFFDLLKDLAIAIWPERHVTDPNDVRAQTAKWDNFLATDLTTADDTIGLQLLEQMRELYIEPILLELARRGVCSDWERKFIIDYDASVADREILAPARSLEEDACVLRMIGGVKSGERGTTWKDLEAIAALTESRCSRLGQLGRDLDFLSWGDDVLVMSKAHLIISPDDWARVTDGSHLWKDKVDVDPSFLARHIPGGYSYLSWMVARRLNRESAEEPSSALACALSISAAKNTLEGHPLAHLYHPWIDHSFPRLRTANNLAARSDTITLANAYISGRRSIEPVQFSRSVDIDLFQEGGQNDEDEGVSGDSIWYAKIGEALPAEVDERKVWEFAGRHTIRELISFSK